MNLKRRISIILAFILALSCFNVCFAEDVSDKYSVENEENISSEAAIDLDLNDPNLFVYPVAGGNLYYYNNVTHESYPSFPTGYIIGADEGVTYADIPNKIQGHDVTGIYDDAFDNHTSLISVSIPESVQYVSGDEFSGCTSLRSIQVDKNNPYRLSVNGALIGKVQWNSTDLRYYLLKVPATIKNYDIPDMVKYIGGNAFEDNTMTSITIPDGIKEIGGDAFNNCTSLKSVNIPNTVTTIGNGAFAHSSLETINVTNNVVEIGRAAFYECPSLKNINLSDSNIKEIYAYTFFGCSLTNMIIPNSVKYIDEWAFAGSSSLTSVTIPASVVWISPTAFASAGYYDNLIFQVKPGSYAEQYAIESGFNVSYGAPGPATPSESESTTETITEEEPSEDTTQAPPEESSESTTEESSEATTQDATEAPSENTTADVTEAPSEDTTAEPSSEETTDQNVTEASSENTTADVTESSSEDTTAAPSPEETTDQNVTEAPSENTTADVTEGPSEETTAAPSSEETTGQNVTESPSESTTANASETNTETTTHSTPSGGSGGGGGGGSSSGSGSGSSGSSSGGSSSGGGGGRGPSGSGSGSSGSSDKTDSSKTDATENTDNTDNTEPENTDNTNQSNETPGETGSSNPAPISDVSITIGNSTINIGGKSYDMGVAPYIQPSSNSTLVPLRFIAAILSGENIENADSSAVISWNATAKQATVTSGNNKAIFTADSNIIEINGVKTPMDNNVKAEIKNDRMFVPFRAIGNFLGVAVDWDDSTRTATYNAK